MDKIASGEITKDDVLAESREMLHGTTKEMQERSEDLAKVIWAGMDEDKFLGPCEVCEKAGRTVHEDGSPNRLRVIDMRGGKRFWGCEGYNRDDPEHADSCGNSGPLPGRGYELWRLEERCSVCETRPRLTVKGFRGRPWKLCLNDDCPTMVEMREKRAERQAAKEAREAAKAADAAENGEQAPKATRRRPRRSALRSRDGASRPRPGPPGRRRPARAPRRPEPGVARVTGIGGLLLSRRRSRRAQPLVRRALRRDRARVEGLRRSRLVSGPGRDGVLGVRPRLGRRVLRRERTANGSSTSGSTTSTGWSSGCATLASRSRSHARSTRTAGSPSSQTPRETGFSSGSRTPPRWRETRAPLLRRFCMESSPAADWVAAD